MIPENLRNVTAADLLVGGDPEFFLIDEKTGEYVSAHNLLPGTKAEPHRMEHGCVQVDGTAVEFNIDPARTEDEFVANVQNTIACIRTMLDQRYSFVFRGAISYRASYFSKLPKRAVELGCSPDYSGYTFTHNPTPNAEAVGSMRTASGHVTVGWNKELLSPEDTESFDNVLLCGRVARNLDITLGLPSLAWDRDRVRRQLYGKAGAFRPKPFGIEYRVLSNCWINHSERIRAVYRGAIEGVLDFFHNAPECMFMNHRQDDVLRQLGGQ